MLSSWRYVVAGVVACLVLGTNAQAGVQVQFNQDEYAVQADQEFDVSILVNQTDLSAGLMSMGVGIAFDSAYAEVLSIDVVTALDDDGTGAPGHRQFGAGYGRAAGFFADAGTYTNGQLVTFHMRNLATQLDLAPGDSYPLTLGLFDGTASFANFVDGDTYQDIDSDIVFGTANVVVPEPVTLSLMAVGGMALLRRRGR